MKSEKRIIKEKIFLDEQVKKGKRGYGKSSKKESPHEK